MRAWLRRLVATLRSDDRDLSAELESHIQLHVDEGVRRGLSPEAARREAILALGGVDETKERVRDQARLRGLESVWQDLRYGARALRKKPGFTAIVIATFALGIGANTAIFAAVNSVLLRPLPYPDHEQLVMVWATDRKAGDDIMPLTPGAYADLRASATSFSGLAASSDQMVTLTGDGDPETVIGYRLAPEMFPLIGLRPALGRTFVAEDDPKVVVLSDKLWRRRFRADPDVVGRTILVDHQSYRVIGVMPPEFRHPAQTELWTPFVIPPDQAQSRTRTFLRVVGRLRPGVTVEQARAEVRAISAGLARAHPETDAQRGIDVVSLRTMTSGDARPALLILLGAVGFVLLLTCANIAGLSLARASARRREIAVRAALGAGRMRIVRQLLTESLLLAFAGGAAGLLLALWVNRLLVGLFPRDVANLQIPHLDAIPLDGTVLLFTAGAALVAGLVAGALPAVHASRTDLHEVLKEGGRGSPRGARLRPVLVAAQIGLALVLSAGAGLLVRSAQLRSRSLGFDTEHVLTARVILDRTRYPQERRRQLLDAVLARLRAAPGVTAAGAVSFLPLCGWSSGITFFDPDAPTEEREAGLQIAEPGYFATLRVPIQRGRGFGAADGPGAPKVAIVDERFVQRFLAGKDPVGRRENFGTLAEPDLREIVGVVATIENDPPPMPARPMVYLPFAQEPWSVWGLVVRAGGDTTAAAAAVRDAVWSVDPEQPVSYVMTMDAMVADALAAQRVSSWLVTVFAALALGLAALGVYGALAQSVIERSHEIGIRLALGAQPRHVLGPMLRRLGAVTGAGLAVGVPVALLAARLLGALLYGVSPADPVLLAIVVVVLLIVAGLAAYAPLRRALRVDPLVALREE